MNRNRPQFAGLTTALLLTLAIPLCAQQADPGSRLIGGTRAVLNMTLSTLFEPSEWLPAQRRRADEPADDWKWTLRSTANRPLLR